MISGKVPTPKTAQPRAFREDPAGLCVKGVNTQDTDTQTSLLKSSHLWLSRESS